MKGSTEEVAEGQTTASVGSAVNKGRSDDEDEAKTNE